jgi:hypothetical protein
VARRGEAACPPFYIHDSRRAEGLDWATAPPPFSGSLPNSGVLSSAGLTLIITSNLLPDGLVGSSVCSSLSVMRGDPHPHLPTAPECEKHDPSSQFSVLSSQFSVLSSQFSKNGTEGRSIDVPARSKERG